jgi:hypothetical protein
MGVVRRSVALRGAILGCAVIFALGIGGTVAHAASQKPVVSDPVGPPAPSGLKPFRSAATPSSPWTPLANQPSFGAGSMLLLPDGSVLVHQDNTRNWWKLKPNAKGDYIHGTWTQVASSPLGYAPLYYASAVLPNGKVIIEGGEYNGSGSGVWTTLGALYDPVKNTWVSVSPPSGWSTIGDAQSAVLPNGKFMLANCCTTDEALFNPSTLTWTSTGTGKADINDEEGWTLLPTGQLLTVDVSAVPGSELYTPSTGKWTSGGSVPVTLPDSDFELGPALARPTNSVFAIGATGANAVYTPSGTSAGWSTGPSLPVIGGQQYDSADGAAATMPGGSVLLDASPGDYNSPTHYFVYNGTSLTQVTDPPNAPSQSSYITRMLVLPTGQVMLDDGSSDVEIYRPTGTPSAAWEPTITSVPTSLTAGSSFTLSGTQLAGRDQGGAYGDDFQDATNYPLVRITNNATGRVTYARTTGLTSYSIKAGATASTNFKLPVNTPTGASTLEVVANGIASAPTSVTVS